MSLPEDKKRHIAQAIQSMFAELSYFSRKLFDDNSTKTSSYKNLFGHAAVEPEELEYVQEQLKAELVEDGTMFGDDGAAIKIMTLCLIELFDAGSLKAETKFTKQQLYNGPPVKCTGCQTINEFAAPNQPNGTYMCFNCRV